MQLFSLEVETVKAIAGEAAIEPKAAWEAIEASGVKASDFVQSLPRKLFAAMEVPLRKGERLDAIALVRLVASGQSEEAQVFGWLTETFAGQITQRLAALKDQAQRNQTYNAIKAIAGQLTDTGIPLGQIAEELQKACGLAMPGSLRVDNLQADFFGFLDELDEIRAGRRTAVVPTGIDALDDVIGGLRPTLIVIGGLPGVGKGAICAAIQRNLAKRKIKSGLISLEDEKRWLTRRLTADASGVSLFTLTTRPTTQHQAERIAEVAEEVHNQLEYIYCEDTEGQDIAAVLSRCRRMVAQGCKAIFLDHFGEIAMDTTERQDLEIANHLQQLRIFARAAKVPVVVFAHLKRRQGLTRADVPLLTDFAGGSAFERKSRLALGVFRFKTDGEGGEANFDPSKLGVVVLKQTEGKADVVIELNVNPGAAIVADTPVPKPAIFTQKAQIEPNEQKPPKFRRQFLGEQ